LGLGLRRGSRRDVKKTIDHACDDGISQRQRPALPAWDARTGIGDGEIPTSAHFVVHPPSPMGPQVGVELALQRSNLFGGPWIVGVKPLTLRCIGVGLLNDV